MHSNSFRDPVWQKMVEVGSRETNGEIDKFCIGCHAPIGLITGKMVSFKDFKDADPAIKDGVQCNVCHSIKTNTNHGIPGGKLGNASLVLDPGPVKRGPYQPGFMMEMVAGHQGAYSELHTKSEICANCHNIFNPKNNHPVAATYDEWKKTVYAEKGIVCQDCHMVTADEAYQVATTFVRVKKAGHAAETGPSRDSIHDHFFVGGNFAVTDLLDADEKVDMAEERLSRVASVDIILPQSATKGSTCQVGFKVTNVAAGHNLPTGMNELRQMWLEVFVRDSSDKVLLSIGELDNDGNIDPKAVIYNSRVLDKDGKPTLKIWEMDHTEYDNSIPAKQSKTSTFKLDIPADAKSPLTVVAFLHYRSFPQSFINELFGDEAFIVPVVEMVTKQVEMKVK